MGAGGITVGGGTCAAALVANNMKVVMTKQQARVPFINNASVSS
jgi:hypothetical protein